MTIDRISLWGTPSHRVLFSNVFF